MKYAFFNNKIKFIFVSVFIVGIIIGTIIVNCMNKSIAMDFIVYYKYLVDKCRWTGIEFKSFYIFLLKKWLRELLILVILGLTSYKIIFHCIYVFYQGIKMSVLIALLTLINGPGGLPRYLVLYGFPQIIFTYLLINVIYDMDFRARKDVKQRIKMGTKWLLTIFLLALVESGINMVLFVKIV